MSIKQKIKMPDFEADQQDAMKKTEGIQSIADQVERLEGLLSRIEISENNLKDLIIDYGLVKLKPYRGLTKMTKYFIQTLKQLFENWRK